MEKTIWVVMSPVILLAGTRIGFSSPSEAEVFVCLYSVFAGASIYKELTIQPLLKALRDNIGDIGPIVIIVSLTVLFGYGTPIDKIPQKMTVFIIRTTANPASALIFTIILLVFVGVFVEGSIVVLLLAPILLPMHQPVGINPVHPGLLIYVIVTMGVNTPPVGISTYTVNTILGRSLQEYTRSMIPLLAATPPAIGLPTLFPDAVLFLPQLLY